jgi:lipid-binding SYLF domain-containing protein
MTNDGLTQAAKKGYQLTANLTGFTKGAWNVNTRIVVLLLATSALCLARIESVSAQGRETSTVDSAGEVLQDITAIPERGLPPALLHSAEAVAIIPDLIKLGFVVGGRHGRGVLLVRDPNGMWSNPIFVSLTGGSIGWQAGASATDVVLVFRSHRGVENILKGRDKITLGADAAIAAGPVGRQAEAGTDLQLKAEILSYSRSRGLFAGAALEGSSLRIDWRANSAYYRTGEITPGDIVAGRNIPGVPLSGYNLKMFLAKISK